MQSNHFDAGFTDQLDAVVNSYFDIFFPGAVALAAELRARGGEERLRWMTQSWLVALYLDCSAIKRELPELHCPNATAVASFEAAIRRGDVWWHAFPHNAELAAADAGMIRAGVNITHMLDARFGLAPKRTLSQRDVPGISRATVPILAAAGVPYISIGTNNGPYKPVSLPNAFVWRDPSTKTESIVTWHNFGYVRQTEPIAHRL